jgi:hypothetical protein
MKRCRDCHWYLAHSNACLQSTGGPIMAEKMRNGLIGNCSDFLPICKAEAEFREALKGGNDDN